jgi:hypothetical protein
LAYVYRYVDKNDQVVKYIGIVYGKNRTLRQRIKEHFLHDSWCNENFIIEYIYENIKTRTDAEYLESHYISYYNTDKYYNIAKSGWGTSSFIPERNDWEEFNTYELYKDIRIKNKTSFVFSRYDGVVDNGRLIKILN